MASLSRSKLNNMNLSLFKCTLCNKACRNLYPTVSVVRWYKGSARYARRREWNKKMAELTKLPPKRFDYKSFISSNYDKELYAFANRLNINPDNAQLRKSLVHRSFLTNNESNSRDELHNGKLAVLGFNITSRFISEYLFFTYPNLPSSGLRSLQDYLLSRELLVKVAKSLSIPELIQTQFDLDSLEENLDNNVTKGDIISDSILALIASIYLDEGNLQARAFVNDFITVELYSKELGSMVTFQNPETLLSAVLSQQNKQNPIARLLTSSTKHTHSPSYVVAVYSSETLLAKGISSTLQKARDEAYYAALVKVINSKIPQQLELPSDRELEK